MTTAAQLADEILAADNGQRPVLATLDGFREYDDRLGDHSEAGDAAAMVTWNDILSRARALDPAALSASDRVTCAVIRTHAEASVDRLAARGVEYTVTAYHTAPVAGLLMALPMVGITEPAQAAGYLARLRGIPAMLATVADRHRAGVAAGRLPVRRLVEAAIEHLDRHLANRDAGPLARPHLPGDATFAVDRDRLIDDVVRPALASYRTVLAEEIAPHGRPDQHAGLCWLPGGGEIYERLIRAHTTVAHSAEQLHRIGLDLIERLAEEYRAIGARLFGPIGVPDLFRRMRTDPALRWRDGDEILSTARAAVARAERAAPHWFGRLPLGRCTVRPVPDDEAPDAPTGNYLRAAADGSRAAIYFANTHRPRERDRYTGEAIAFHEVVPGHHLQVGLAQELVDLPPMRRVIPVDAFAEGWGLYAERLADEMGLYSDDLARLGMLAADSTRAARLVADTGLHALGWSRERAVEFVRTRTPTPPVDVDREINRYLSDPGQALAYMVGRLEIDRIRHRAQQALGNGFDIRAFHDTVLGNGEIPLGTLAEVVDRWVDTHARPSGVPAP